MDEEPKLGIELVYWFPESYFDHTGVLPAINKPNAKLKPKGSAL